MPRQEVSHPWEQARIRATLCPSIWVQMDSLEEARPNTSSLVLPDNLRTAMLCSGTVVHCADEAALADGITPGKRVIGRPDGGTRIEGQDLGGYVAANLAVFGPVSASHDEVLMEPYEENILATIEGERLCLKGTWVLLYRKAVEREGMLWLPEKSQYKTGEATVATASPRTGLTEDQKVLYHLPAVHNGCYFADELKQFGFDGDPRDYIFIKAENIYGVIE